MENVTFSKVCLLLSVCVVTNTFATQKTVAVPESNVQASGVLTRICGKVRNCLGGIRSGASKVGVYVSNGASKAWEKVPASAKNSMSFVKRQCSENSIKLWSAATRTTTRKIVSGTIAIGTVAALAAWRILKEKAPVKEAIA